MKKRVIPLFFTGNVLPISYVKKRSVDFFQSAYLKSFKVNIWLIYSRISCCNWNELFPFIPWNFVNFNIAVTGNAGVIDTVSKSWILKILLTVCLFWRFKNFSWCMWLHFRFWPYLPLSLNTFHWSDLLKTWADTFLESVRALVHFHILKIRNIFVVLDFLCSVYKFSYDK